MRCPCRERDDLLTRALFVAPSSVPGGSQRVLTALTRHLPAQGVEVSAVLLQHGPLEQWLDDAGCTTHVLDAGRTREVWRTAPAILELAARAADADVIVSSETKGHVYGGLAAARAGVPAVWWQHGTPTRNRIDLVAARVPARAIVCYTEEVAVAQRWVAPGRNVVVISGGIAIEEIQARAGSGAAVRARHGWDEDPVVGIVGRLQTWKGQDTFLRAAALVANKVPHARFVVVGGPSGPRDEAYAQSLPRLADDLRIRSRTFFAGHQDDPYPWFDAFDLVVHASDDEPFGLVVLEGMALGKPVVASAAGGPREIIEHGRSGLLVPPRDEVRMANAIEEILSDPALAATLCNGARRRVKWFSEEKMAERLAAVVEAATEPTAIDYRRAGSESLEARTVPGLHDHLVAHVVPKPSPRLQRAVDLGAGSGAFAERLQTLGFDVLACDQDAQSFRARLPYRRVDLNDPNFADTLGTASYDLVTAIEVIEHLEAPIGFLRNISRLLAAGGVAVLTTPNLDSLAARVKFLVKGKLRLLDEHGDPTHISPIFWDLLIRQYLPRSGLDLVDHTTYPRWGHVSGRPSYQRVINALGPVIARDPLLVGDNHVLVVTRHDQ
jgi:glycosyltransferase involved in cell wall biosynthesis/2-polyprenyl-3-methyl-5-hydroxy-6-metoxy-1,4-benzoquinol methylase